MRILTFIPPFFICRKSAAFICAQRKCLLFCHQSVELRTASKKTHSRYGLSLNSVLEKDNVLSQRYHLILFRNQHLEEVSMPLKAQKKECYVPAVKKIIETWVTLESNQHNCMNFGMCCMNFLFWKLKAGWIFA